MNRSRIGAASLLSPKRRTARASRPRRSWPSQPSRCCSWRPWWCFFLIAELLNGSWMLAGSAVVVLAFLLWLGNRLVHVAANQNKNPLG